MISSARRAAAAEVEKPRITDSLLDERFGTGLGIERDLLLADANPFRIELRRTPERGEKSFRARGLVLELGIRAENRIWSRSSCALMMGL